MSSVYTTIYIELDDEEIDEAEEQAWQKMREDALMDCDEKD